MVSRQLLPSHQFILSVFANEGDRNPCVSIYSSGIKLVYGVKERCPNANVDDILFYLNHCHFGENVSQRFDTATDEFLIVSVFAHVDTHVNLV